MIEVTNLTKTCAENVAVDDLSFTGLHGSIPDFSAIASINPQNPRLSNTLGRVAPSWAATLLPVE